MDENNMAIDTKEEMYRTSWYRNLSENARQIVYFIAEGLLDDEYIGRMKDTIEDLITADKKIVIDIEDGKLVYKVRDLADVLFERLGRHKDAGRSIV